MAPPLGQKQTQNNPLPSGQLKIYQSGIAIWQPNPI